MVLGETLGKFDNEQNRINSELSVGEGNEFTILDIISNELTIGNFRVKESTQNIAGNTLIWGNTDFGTWGSFYWGAGAQTSFVLGHSIAGVLGTSQLGSNTSEYQTIGVYNDADTFPEGFWNDRFISSNSSGSWFETEKFYQLDYGEILETEIIAKENKIYKSVYITLDTEYAAGSYVGSDANDDIQVYASNDIGTTWQLVPTMNITKTLSGGNVDGLKIKIENFSGDTGILVMPVTMPIEFTGAIININEFTVKYGT